VEAARKALHKKRAQCQDASKSTEHGVEDANIGSIRFDGARGLLGHNDVGQAEH